MERNTHEVYCSLETSKLLEQAGFDWDTEYVYVTVNGNTAVFPFWSTSWALICDECYVRPTLDVARRWLREIKHEILQVEYSNVTNLYYADCCSLNDWHEVGDKDGYNTYESALEAGIKKCLEIIIKN